MDIKIGFIGLGIMGRPMALNLIRRGFQVGVYGRRREACLPLEKEGATVHSTLGELAATSNLVITIVSNTPDVEDVLFGPNGIAEGLKKGSLVIDMSTISPVATRNMAARLNQQGVDMLDAPVSGGETGAINATLSIMVGGSKSAFERALPLFQALGKNIIHLGESGAGQVTKACNQLLISQTIAAVAEAFTLARISGVEPALVRQALMGGSAYSKVLEGHGERMLTGNFQPGFRARLMRKDMQIVSDTALHEGIALPGAALVTQYLNALIGDKDGDLDAAAIFKIVQKINR